MINDNNTKSYLIYSFNDWFIILFFFVGLILPLIIIERYIQNKNATLFAITIILFMVLAYFLARYLGLRPVKVNFNNEKIVFQYLAKNLKTVKKEKTISMKYIKEFSDFTFGNHDVFKLKLHYNTTFRIYKNGFWNKNDDFEILTNDFKNFIEAQNTSEIVDEELTDKKRKIEYKDFFQTQKATLLFYGTIVVGLWAMIITIMGKSHSPTGSFIVIGGMLGYIGTYLAKKNKQE